MNVFSKKCLGAFQCDESHAAKSCVASSDILIVIRFGMGPEFNDNYTIGCRAAGS